MKKKLTVISVMVLILAMIAMVSCGKSEFGCTENEEDHMLINAVKADTGDFFMTGTLEVEDDEQIAIDSNLESGGVTIEFIRYDGNESSQEIPDLDGEATYTANVSGTDSQAVSFGGGDYMVKATVSEKATGTIEINVKDLDD